MPAYTLQQRLFSEFLGSAFLLATVVGSGIMAETLPGSNVAVQLLCNSTATGAILYVLITMLGPISGAHFNPAVTLAFCMRGEIGRNEAALFVLMQIAGGVCGVLATHLMFDQSVMQISLKLRDGPALWFSEIIATFGLVATILLTLKANASAVPTSVALYIAAAYWFTASTSFANPAVTIARGFSDTFAGINPANVPAFIVAQLVGAVLAVYVCRFLLGQKRAKVSTKAPAAAE